MLQKYYEGYEQPIAFFSSALRDAKLKYNIMEKKAYALVRAFKYFRIYILHSKVIAYVPSSSIRGILMQPDNDGKRSKWIAKILEYDMEVKPTKLGKGKGLEKLLLEGNCKDLGIHVVFNNSNTNEFQNGDKDLLDRSERKIVCLSLAPMTRHNLMHRYSPFIHA